MLYDGRLASCSGDQTIKIYDFNDDKYGMTLRGHSGTIYCICELSNGKLVSCSSDKTIKIWKILLTSYKCEHTITNAHNDIIWKVITLSNNRIASCSEGNIIKIWNSNRPYNLIKELSGHTDYVTSIIQLKEKETLISCSKDECLCIWDLSTYQCVSIIKGLLCLNSHSMIQFENKVIIGGYKGLSFVNLNKYLIEHKTDDDCLKNVYSLLIVKGHFLICGCFQGIFIYNIKLNIIEIFDIKLRDNCVYCLISVNENCFASSSNEVIKLWKV